MKSPARDDWDALVTEVTPTQNNLGRAFTAMFIQILGDKTPRNLSFYMERTKKPRCMKAREWIRRLQVLNLYIDTMVGGRGNFSATAN